MELALHQLANRSTDTIPIWPLRDTKPAHTTGII